MTKIYFWESHENENVSREKYSFYILSIVFIIDIPNSNNTKSVEVGNVIHFIIEKNLTNKLEDN